MGLTEVAFRIFPPSGVYNPGYSFDRNIGYRFRPNSQVIYNRANGLVENLTNGQGWVDIDHEERKPKGQFRVGFFGDSYVEGLSVPSERHFFRTLPEKISGTSMEYFGFGMSGLGTVHSYLHSKQWVDTYNLDLVVYVFVENDIGDNISWIKKMKNRPYAVKASSESGFTIEKNYRDYPVTDEKISQRLREFAKTWSMLARVVDERIQWLEQVGAKIQVDEKDMEMENVTKEGTPDSNDLPSTWPKDIRSHTQEVAFSILKAWSSEVNHEGKSFSVLYVPRGSNYLSPESQNQETFKRWLVNSCESLNIPLIDPSSLMFERQADGVEVYRDHWTIAGHAVVKDVVNEWLQVQMDTLKNRLPKAS